MAARILFVAVVMLAGCSRQEPRVERITIREPIEVAVPVLMPCKPEPGLLTPIGADLPEFVASCPPASSGLTPENEKKLQKLLVAHAQRLRAWRAWAEECGADSEPAPKR